MDFQEIILKWYKENGRDFPWRDIENLFHILVAETMLRRTTSTHVLKVYEDFISEFSRPEEVLNADKEHLLDYLCRLGLQNQRYRDLKTLCQKLVESYQGKVPKSQERLIDIDGIGEYIANSTLCFGARKKLPVVDSNVKRVLRRVFSLESEKKIKEKARSLLPGEGYVDYNYALLDFGALVCRPQNPKCEKCSLCDLCEN